MDFRTTSMDLTKVMQAQSFWFPGSDAAESAVGICAVTDSLCGLRKQGKQMKFVYFASRFRHGSIHPLQRRLHEPSFHWVLQCACSLSVLDTATEAPTVPNTGTIKDKTTKLPPMKRSKLPARKVKEIHKGPTPLQVAPVLTSFNHQESPLYNPDNRIVSYFQQLDLKGQTLKRCLRHACELSEEDVMKLMVTFRSFGLTRGHLRSLLSKYPSLIKVKRAQVERVFRYFLGLGFSSGKLIRLCVKRPALIDSDLEGARQIIDYLVSIGIQKEELPETLLKRPQILEQNVDVVKDTVCVLTKARISQTDLRRLLKRAPEIFVPAIQGNFQSNLEFWLSVGVEGRALSRALLRRPNLLSYNVESMQGTYKFLQGWMQPGDLSKLVRRYGELLAVDPERKLEPLITYLLKLGVKKEDIGKVILRRPQLMAFTIAGLERTVHYLKSIGVKEKMLGKVITVSPQVFTLNAEEKLKRAVEFFRSIGLDKTRDMEFLFSRNPQILCCSIERNLCPKFEFFLNTGLSKEAIASMIVLFPSMLGQSIEHSLLPKYNYLVKVMERPVQELVYFPQYFGYSLENRIKPRHKKLAERGVHKSLPSMLACTDKDFDRRYIVRNPPQCQPCKTRVKGNEQVVHLFSM